MLAAEPTELASAAVPSGVVATADPGSLLGSWRTDGRALLIASIAVLVVATYLAACHRSAERRPLRSRWQIAAFVAGCAAATWALCSGVASGADDRCSLNVLDHLVLASLVPVLLAAGTPVAVVRQAVGERTSERIDKVLSSRVAELVTHPIVAFALLIGAQYGYLLTPAYRWSIADPLGGDLIRLAFLLAGCIYWWPVVGLDTWPRRLASPVRMADLAAMIPCTAFLGIDLTTTARPLALSPSLSDTHLGGAVLWGCSTVFIIAALGLVFIHWMHEEDRRALAADRGLDTIAAAERIVDEAARHLADHGDAEP